MSSRAQPEKPKITLASALFVAVGLGTSIYLLAGLPGSSSSSSTSPSVSVTSKGTPEYNLAVIAAGAEVGDNSPELVQFRQVLDEIQAKVPEDRTRISDMIAGGWKVLKEGGQQEPLLSFARNLEQAIPSKNQVPFSDVVTSYVLLRRSGEKAGPYQ